MSESVLINAATVNAGDASAVEAFAIAAGQPEVDFRIVCDRSYTVRFWVADSDFSSVVDAAELAGTEDAHAATTGLVYSVDAGSYDYIACVLTNTGATPATVTIAAGYDVAGSVETALFTVAEARAFIDSGVAPLANAAAFSDEAIIATEATVRARFEAACRVAFLPTTVTETQDGSATNVLRVAKQNPTYESPRHRLTVSAASIDGVALTVTELASLKSQPSGRIVRTDGGSWSSSTGYQDLAVSVTYTHGWSAVPALIKRAALLYAVRILAQGELPLGARDYSDGGPPPRFPYAGKRPHWTGDDEVDSILIEYEEQTVVVA